MVLDEFKSNIRKNYDYKEKKSNETKRSRREGIIVRMISLSSVSIIIIGLYILGISIIQQISHPEMTKMMLFFWLSREHSLAFFLWIISIIAELFMIKLLN